MEKKIQENNNMQKFCVFTTLIGNYEELNEQQVALSSDIDFICFTDDKNLRSETWDVRVIDPILPLDYVRSAKAVKICPHKYLQNYETSLYIDNSITLKVDPEIIFNDLNPTEFDMICFKHSFRDTLMDEYECVIKDGYDKPNIIFEQLNTYSIIESELFYQKPYWGGFIIRNHNQVSIIEAMEDWLNQVLRYSRRDQLSLNYILNRHPIKFRALELDNLDSKYHRWPTIVRYGSATFQRSIYSNIECNIRANAQEQELNRLSLKLREQNLKISELEQLVEFYSQSKSWRVTKVFRNLFNYFRNI
jgi:hypothetical protein